MKKIIIPLTTVLGMLFCSSCVPVLAQDQNQQITQKALDSAVKAAVQCAEKRLNKKITDLSGEVAGVKTSVSTLAGTVETNKNAATSALKEKGDALQASIDDQTSLISKVVDLQLSYDTTARLVNPRVKNFKQGYVALSDEVKTKTGHGIFWAVTIFLLIALFLISFRVFDIRMRKKQQKKLPAEEKPRTETLTRKTVLPGDVKATAANSDTKL